MLKHMQHNPVSAHSGIEALTYLKKDTIDIILTDINMPEMDGFALLDEIHRDERLKEIPIIVMTASSEPTFPLTAREKGATVFMSQPFSSSELAVAVNTCLEKISIK